VIAAYLIYSGTIVSATDVIKSVKAERKGALPSKQQHAFIQEFTNWLQKKRF
jgi:protein-tyrosine phosphatase